MLWLWAVGQNPTPWLPCEQLEEIETVRCMEPTPFRSEETCQQRNVSQGRGFSLRTCPRYIEIPDDWIYEILGLKKGHLGIICRQSASSKPQGFQAQLDLSIQQWVI